VYDRGLPHKECLVHHTCEDAVASHVICYYPAMPLLNPTKGGEHGQYPQFRLAQL
jgi:hypothetical protein